MNREYPPFEILHTRVSNLFFQNGIQCKHFAHARAKSRKPFEIRRINLMQHFNMEHACSKSFQVQTALTQAVNCLDFEAIPVNVSNSTPLIMAISPQLESDIKQHYSGGNGR